MRANAPPDSTMAGVQNFLRSWPLVGLPAFAAIFLPWQNKLTAMYLVSDWFQPSLNVGASIVGSLSCFVAYSYLVRKARARQLRAMVVAFAAFVAALVVCLSLKILIGTMFFPTPGVQVGIWILEVILYLLVFSAFAVSMISAGLLIRSG
jgi:hypothetical protein